MEVSSVIPQGTPKRKRAAALGDDQLERQAPTAGWLLWCQADQLDLPAMIPALEQAAGDAVARNRRLVEAGDTYRSWKAPAKRTLRIPRHARS